MSRRVVVTGLGVVSPLACGWRDYWSALIRGQSGVGPITAFDCTDYSTRIAAEANDFDATDYLDAKGVKRMDRFVQFAAAAAMMAVDDAGLRIGERWSDDVGVMIGSGIGGMWTWETQHKVLLERGPSRVSPFFVPMDLVELTTSLPACWPKVAFMARISAASPSGVEGA